MSSPRRHALVSALLVLGASACRDEGLVLRDLDGTVILPREAARAVLPIRQEDGSFVDTEVTDLRLLGPVYLGLYAQIDYSVELYPHPLLAPGSDPSRADGDAYPYGGTTVGDFRNACLEALSCRIVSGRYNTYQEIVDWWDATLDKPLIDAVGAPITTGEYIQQNCFDLQEVTSDAEIRILPTEDRNGDGAIDASDLDFVADENGDWVGTFRLWEQEFFEGFQLWGFMDAPVGQEFAFSSCDPTLGYTENTYTRNFRAGAQYQDLLNVPRKYINDGDWVASRPFTWDNDQELGEIVIDFLVGTDDITSLREEAEAAEAPAEEEAQ